MKQAKQSCRQRPKDVCTRAVRDWDELLPTVRQFRMTAARSARSPETCLRIGEQSEQRCLDGTGSAVLAASFEAWQERNTSTMWSYER